VEEFECLAGGGGADGGVAGELDVDGARILDFAEGRDDGWEIDFAFAEHEVLVDAGTHVFDVHVHKTITPVADFVGDGELALAVEVADVDGELQQVGLSAGRVEFGEEIGIAGESVDEHAGLGFEAEDDVLVGGVGQDFD
jgi:hypothetical protein